MFASIFPFPVYISYIFLFLFHVIYYILCMFNFPSVMPSRNTIICHNIVQ